MASINKVIIVGNLGKDPDVDFLTNGGQVTNISVATTDRKKDKQTGEYQDLTEWHRISFFGKLAEIAGRYLVKGSQVYVEGRLRTRKYTDKSGIERSATEIIADQMQMLGNRDQTENHRTVAQHSPNPPTASRPKVRDMDDDIPY